MNSMGAFEYRSDKHPLHDRIEQLERENKLLREALEKVAELMLCGKKDHLPGRCDKASKITLKALAAVGEK